MSDRLKSKCDTNKWFSNDFFFHLIRCQSVFRAMHKKRGRHHFRKYCRPSISSVFKHFLDKKKQKHTQEAFQFNENDSTCQSKTSNEKRHTKTIGRMVGDNVSFKLSYQCWFRMWWLSKKNVLLMYAIYMYIHTFHIKISKPSNAWFACQFELQTRYFSPC